MVTTRPPKTIVKPTALGPVANTDTKLLIYGLFQKGRVLAQDAEAPSAQRQAQIASMSRELNERLDGLKAVISGEIAELNRAIEANRVPRIRPPIPRTPTS